MGYAPTTGYWDGVLDEVHIYDRALSASEILERYRFGPGWLPEYGGGTISNEYTIVKKGAASIKFTKGSAYDTIAKLVFPRYNYDYLPLDQIWNGKISIWIHADYAGSLHIMLEDDAGN